MSKAAVCGNCGGSDIDTDQARGNAVCVTCGAVIEDNFIVSEVSFAENTLGGASVIGQFVSSEGDKSHTLGNNFRHSFGRESRTVTLQTGKRHIMNLGGQLKLNQHCTDMAYNFFKMAVQKKLTRGRKTMHIVAACLYLVCRLESTPHMLLDLSDLLQVNVYVLGKTYLKLCQELHINVPAIDPCLFIQRFAHKLEFEDKTDEVSMTALRLVSRMKRDWMHTGRRPSGLCGAALLVAARIHNFSRTQKDVIKVVKVCDATLRKRLSEFEETPSGKLTIDEFHKIDLEEEQDPPSFTRGRRNAKLAQLEELSKKQVRELEGEIATVQHVIDSALQKKTEGMPTSSSKPDDASSSSDSLEALGTNSASADDIVKTLQEDVVRTIIESEVDPLRQSKSDDARPPRDNDDEADRGKESEGCGGKEDGGKTKTSEVSGEGAEGGGGDAEGKTPGPEQEKMIETLLGPVVWEADAKSVSGLGPSTLSLGLESIIQEAAIPEEKSVDSEDGELDLSGIDDKEIEAFILNEKEVIIKTDLWMKENGEYMKYLEEKEKRLQKEREEQGLKPDQPKKKRKNTKRQPIQANTAGEAIEKLIVEKKISSKINYDVLRDLTQPSPAPMAPPPAPPTPDTPSSSSATHVPGSPFPMVGQANLGRDGGGLKRPRPSIAMARSSVMHNGPVRKAAKLEEQPAQPFTVPQPTPSDAVVVESGPVHFDAEDGLNQEEEGEDDYFDEDEDHLQSAAQLMGHRGEEDYQDTYDMDDLE